MELVIDNLACRRSGREVLRGVSFRLATGQAAALRGPNGVGKSTLLRVLAGLVPMTGGSVRLGEISLRKDQSAFQERLAYAGHLDAVKPALSVRENLALWSRIHDADAGKADGALAHFGLAAIASRSAGECSAGQKRRLGLARLAVLDKPLWLLDEPTVSLDTAAVALLAELVRAHLSAGGMALIATHADLGLGELPTLTLDPLTADETTADPFLEGAW
ncbi:MAG: heme ABC exporter ATP-binding protein CcmA [Pseudomonadota bacterium]